MNLFLDKSINGAELAHTVSTVLEERSPTGEVLLLDMLTLAERRSDAIFSLCRGHNSPHIRNLNRVFGDKLSPEMARVCYQGHLSVVGRVWSDAITTHRYAWQFLNHQELS